MKDLIKRIPIPDTADSEIQMWLGVMHFVHRDGTHIVYSPAMQMTDYGNTSEEAKAAFRESLDIWLEYVSHFGTFEADLERLGWTTIDGNTYYPPKYDLEEIKKEFDIGDFEFFEQTIAA